MITPEWNLKDLADPSSDRFLNIFHDRATQDLQDQFKYGSGEGSLGDHAHIVDMMENGGLGNANAAALKGSYVRFMQGYVYMRTFDARQVELLKQPWMWQVASVYVIPSAVVELVSMRQSYFLWSLNGTIDAILKGAGKYNGIPSHSSSFAKANAAAKAMYNLSLNGSETIRTMTIMKMPTPSKEKGKQG